MLDRAAPCWIQEKKVKLASGFTAWLLDHQSNTTTFAQSFIKLELGIAISSLYKRTLNMCKPTSPINLAAFVWLLTIYFSSQT